MKYNFFVYERPEISEFYLDEYKNKILKFCKNKKIIHDAISITLHFFYKIPAQKSHGKPDEWDYHAMNNHNLFELSTFVVKTLEGILFSNINNVVNINASKYYCLSNASEGTKIEIKTINNFAKE